MRESLIRLHCLDRSHADSPPSPQDYTASSALYQTIESQMIPQFFKIAHTRDLLEAALEILVTRGAYHLSEATLEYVT